MVQRAFPFLANYPSDRIEFLAPENQHAKVEKEDGWAQILDATWYRLPQNAPERLKVQIAESPKEAARRE